MNASAQATPRAAPEPLPATRVAHVRAPLGERVAAWRDQHFYSLFSSLGRMSARPWASGLTVLVLGFALALPMLFWLVYDNARELSSGMREAREITVFLKPELGTDAATAVATRWRTRTDVAEVTLRSPEQGLAEFRHLSGFGEALDALQDNPLPSVLVVMPKAGREGDSGALLAALQADQDTDLIQYDAVWRRKLSGMLHLGQRFVAVIAALLALATLLVIGNTVRMDIQARSGEIAVMQTIGASNGFIRRPFLYAGFWYGLLGGVVALLLVGAVEFALAAPIRALADSYSRVFAIHGITLQVALAVVAAGTLIGWLGAYVVTMRHLIVGRPR
ncbi:MAG: ABC transporter permease [Dokdonella sp.]|nr:ABC transporter permease [Dokdonella sp.]